MEYVRIDKGDGSVEPTTRERMRDQLEEAGGYRRGTLDAMERRVRETSYPARAETLWAVWEVRP